MMLSQRLGRAEPRSKWTGVTLEQIQSQNFIEINLNCFVNLYTTVSFAAQLSPHVRQQKRELEILSIHPVKLIT